MLVRENYGDSLLFELLGNYSWVTCVVEHAALKATCKAGKVTIQNTISHHTCKKSGGGNTLIQIKKDSYLVDGGQIAVSISKGRVDLNGTGVALQRSLYILHFLQCIAHV